MRKLLRRFLIAILVLGGVSCIYKDSTFVQASSNAPYIKFGDINSDGIINEKDTELLQQHIAAVKSDEVYAKHPDWYLKGKALRAADVNSDNKVDVTDELHVLRHIAMEKGEAYISHIVTVTLMDESKTRVYDCFPIIYNWKEDSKNCYPKLYQPSKSGYVFKGWYSYVYRAESYGSLVNIYDHVLCADWEEDKTFVSYRLNFDANGGSCSTEYYTLKPGDSYGTLPVPTRKGYTFTGWYTDSGSKVSSSTKMEAKNVTVYAQWKSNGGGYENAVTLPTNGSWSSEYMPVSSRDSAWYKITIPADGKLSFKTMAYGGLYCALYTEDLSKRIISYPNGGSGTETSPETRSNEAVLSKGLYYLKVYDCKAKYKLNASFVNYHTDDAYALSYDNPQTISLNTTITGAITKTDLEDWYRFRVSRQQNYCLSITSYYKAYFDLYNEDLSRKIASTGGWAISGSESTPQVKKTDVTLSSGVYYLKIYCQANSTGKYFMNISPGDVSVNNITLNKSALTLKIDEGERLTAYVWPSDATNQAVIWKSSNPSVATASDGGFVSAKSAGTAVITATAADGSGAKAACSVTVLGDPETICQREGHIGAWIISKQATALETGSRYRRCTRCHREEYVDIAKLTPTAKVTASQITLKVDQSTTKVKISGLAQGDYVKSWKSNNTGIIKVTNNGKITAQKKTGTALVTVTLASGKKVQIRVKVQKTAVNTSKISGIETALEIRQGTSRTLKPVISPITCMYKVKYTTSNSKVATVSSAGKITAKKKGNAVITVTCGKKKMQCKVTVY